MNSDNILKHQNDEECLTYLMARRYYYDKAKLLQKLRVSIALTLPTLAILSNIYSWGINNKIAIISSIWLVIVFLTQELEKYLATKGAKAQEYFDTTLFCLPWNEILVGEYPQQEDLIKVAVKANRKLNYENWYTGLEAKEHFQNVLLAQRMSIVWASRSMRFYKWIVLGLASIYLILAIIYSIIIEQKLEEYLIIILIPSLPILIHATRTFWNLLKLSEKYSEMGNKIVRIFKEKFLNLNLDTKILREIQNFIFIKRCDLLFIPNWFYDMTKVKEEAIIKKVNEQLSKLTWN